MNLIALCDMYSIRERAERARHLLGQVDMAEQARKLPNAISGGQQQRVAIARALANDPPILVADEPTGNLDSNTAQAIFSLFERLVAGGKTILIVTHDNDLAQRVSRTVIIADGEIVNTQRSRGAGEQGRNITLAPPLLHSPASTQTQEAGHAT